jgi:hypothetical protein
MLSAGSIPSRLFLQFALLPEFASAVALIQRIKESFQREEHPRVYPIHEAGPGCRPVAIPGIPLP